MPNKLTDNIMMELRTIEGNGEREGVWLGVHTNHQIDMNKWKKEFTRKLLKVINYPHSQIYPTNMT